jgi:cell division protein FtsB
MRRNLILVLAIVVGLLLANSSIAKIASFRGTSNEVSSAQAKLDQLKQENAQLKQDLAYKKSDQFAEGEIRDKLGLAKPGEQVFVVPKSDDSQSSIDNSREEKSNWQKWKDYLF